VNWQIEITRNNVTPAQFLASVRHECKKKGIDCSINLKEFAEPLRPMSISYYVKDGVKYWHDYDENGKGYHGEYPGEDAPCVSEICTSRPYNCHTYILNFDGSCYNEICEFTFDSETHGHGYYFQLNKE
jgi:hypothetical protein